jgi:hypothetical protein
MECGPLYCLTGIMTLYLGFCRAIENLGVREDLETTDDTANFWPYHKGFETWLRSVRSAEW